MAPGRCFCSLIWGRCQHGPEALDASWRSEEAFPHEETCPCLEVRQASVEMNAGPSWGLKGEVHRRDLLHWSCQSQPRRPPRLTHSGSAGLSLEVQVQALHHWSWCRHQAQAADHPGELHPPVGPRSRPTASVYQEMRWWEFQMGRAWMSLWELQQLIALFQAALLQVRWPFSSPEVC